MLEWQRHRKCDVVILAYMAFQQSFGQAIWHCTKPFHKACCSELDAFSTANQDSSLWFALLIVPAKLACMYEIYEFGWLPISVVSCFSLPPTRCCTIWWEAVFPKQFQKIAIWMLPSKDGEIDITFLDKLLAVHITIQNHTIDLELV